MIIRIARAAALVVAILALAPLSSTAAPAPAKPDSITRAAVRDGWPDTRAGVLAYRWTTAFSKGESAMRACLADIIAPEGLAKRSVDARMASYRDLHDRFGTLMLVKVESSTAGEVVASLAAADLTQWQFTFTAQTRSPYKLLTVSFRDRRQSHGHGDQNGGSHP